MRKISRQILCFALLGLAGEGYCGISTYNSGPVIVNKYLVPSSWGQVITLQDDQYHYMHNNPSGGYPFVNHTIQDFLSLQFTGASGTVYSAFTVTVDFEIVKYDTVGRNIGLSTGTLSINYNPASQTSEIPRDDYEVNWGDSIMVIITGVTYSNPSGQTPNMPGDVELTSRITVDRYWEFNWNNNLLNSPAISGVINTPDNTLNLAWSYLQGAEEYDLEWVFVSAYAPQNVPPDFTQATRITTTEQNYIINLAYDIGSVYYRIRGAEPMQPGMTERLEGVWSNYSSVQVPDLDKQRNWTYSSAYAEQGKRKEVLTFFDGSGRQRQAVTENNSSNIALISETMYDYEGRVGVTTLAAPNNTDASVLQFYQDLNLNLANNAPYSRKIFNVEPAGTNCSPATPNGMNGSDGSANYYSENNTLLGQYGLNTAIASSIPDAGNPQINNSDGIYPFTETLYGIDGKVSEQAGAGTILNEGNGHTTKYFYATPFQSDLDKIFGLEESGDASHFQEKAIQDPNGQVSISYLNMAGKVVATSITGPPPSNSPLKQVQATSNVTQPYTSILNPWNKPNSADNAMEINTDFLNKNANTLYTFTYSMNPASLSTCIPSNITDAYDLDIKVIDQCNNLLQISAGSLPTNVSVINNDEIVGTNISLSSSFTFSVTCGDVGTYYISKVLSIDPTGLTTAQTNFTNAYPGSCGSSLASLVTTYSTNVNTSNCNTCDEQCESDATNIAHLVPGSLLWTAYVNNCEATNCTFTPPIPSQPSPPSNTPQQCSQMLTMLEADMSPGGQYFDDIPASNPTKIPDNTWLQNNIPGGVAGLYTWTQNSANNCPSNGLTSSSNWNWTYIRNNWQPCYVNYLVQFHPEYCRYNDCVALSASNAYDYTLSQNNNSLNWAENNGAPTYPYVNSSNNPYDASNVFNDDPFFMTGGPGNTNYYYPMSGQITNFNNSGMSMWQYANSLVINPLAYPPNGYPSNSNYTWQEFLALYEQQKLNYIEQWESSNGPTYCQALCDAGTNSSNGVPTGIACTCTGVINCNGNPAANGFYIREPDFLSAANQIIALSNPTTYTTAVTGTYGDGTINCQNPSTITLYIDPSTVDNSTPGSGNLWFKWAQGTTGVGTITVNGNGTITETGATGIDQWISVGTFQCYGDGDGDETCQNNQVTFFLNTPCGEITCGKVVESYTATPTQIIQDIENAINSTCSYMGFHASWNSSTNQEEITGTPPIACNWPNNSCATSLSIWKTCISSEPYDPEDQGCPLNSINLTCSWTTQPCTVTQTQLKDCFCVEMDQLTHEWNNSTPNLDDYIANNLNTAYGTSIAGTDVQGWIDNCNNHYYPSDLSGNNGPPSVMNCNPGTPCPEDAFTIANYDAQTQYAQQEQNDLINFTGNYDAACFNSADGYSEDMSVTYSSGEYQYTLYYYDLAGNLTRTVPPAGVTVLSQGDVINIEDSRLPVTDPNYTVCTVPPIVHHKITRYKYNTLNELVYENTPDANETDHWYDYIGRLRFSQNAKQAAAGNPGNYSYNKYDALGRVIETGESNEDYSSSANFYSGVNDETFPAVPYTEQVTQTYYDNIFPGSTTALQAEFDGSGQQNLRSRIATTTYATIGNTSASIYDYATHYSYDVHGNVCNLVQDNPSLGIFTESGSQEYKMLRYEYDLVSGNVNMVDYQPGAPDRFIHKYEYDADNRITNAYTSIDSVIWDQDAKYFYYLHGPPAREEIGQDKAQGSDYVYTLQGWLKGVNSNVLSEPTDVGYDGMSPTDITYLSKQPGIHSNIARDAFGYTLNYFVGDYTSINPLSTASSNNFYTNGIANSNTEDLFNGNIKQVAVALSNLSNTPLGLMDNHYQYDQLNRLLQSVPYINAGSLTNYSGAAPTNSVLASADLATTYTYDFDGNITNLTRNGITSAGMNNLDNLAYTYTVITPNVPNNLLDNVQNTGLLANCGNIPAGQTSGNYTYDPIGELTGDAQEQIGDIDWSVSGKVLSVVRSSGTKSDLYFSYDPMGNRICKLEKPKNSGGNVLTQDQWIYTYYVRDATGNIMAIYNRRFLPQSAYTMSAEEFTLSETPIYGSKRLGDDYRNAFVSAISYTPGGYNSDGTVILTYIQPGLVINSINVPPPQWGPFYQRTTGSKSYELDDHLGDVLMTVSDRKLPNGAVNNSVNYFTADVLSYTYYYPFGQTLCGAGFYGSSGPAYRFAYNGKEQDAEIKGQDNSYDYGMRMYDPRLGRFMSVDPLTKQYAMLTPYQFASNRPIDGNDRDGLEWHGTASGFVWDPGHAWITNTDGHKVLKDNYYVQAVYFSNSGVKGKFDPNSNYNIGTSTAYVCKADGSVKQYAACTNPSDPKFTPLPEGYAEAIVGSHKGKSASSKAYTALKNFTPGIENASPNKMYLDQPNKMHLTQFDWLQGDAVQPDVKAPFSLGSDTHHAGAFNLTGSFPGDDGETHYVSENCLLIDLSKWNDFISNFKNYSGNATDRNNIIGLYIDRHDNCVAPPQESFGSQQNLTNGKEVQLNQNSNNATY